LVVEAIVGDGVRGTETLAFNPVRNEIYAVGLDATTVLHKF
jgi:hypothetical protein